MRCFMHLPGITPKALFGRIGCALSGICSGTFSERHEGLWSFPTMFSGVFAVRVFWGISRDDPLSSRLVFLGQRSLSFGDPFSVFR